MSNHRKAAIMKKLFLLPLALLSSGVTLAQEVGRVISATPIIQQVGVPRQVCTTEQVASQQTRSGAGALMGAIAGGAMCNAVGGGAGKAAATVLGIIGGAALGDSLEGSPSAQFQNIQRCTTQNALENRAIAYSVVYEFGGKQYTVQMPSDPGPTLQLQVTPVGTVSQIAAPTSTVTYAQPLYQEPSYIVSEPRAYYGYPAYYSQANYVPIAALMGMGIWFGSHGHRHSRHWR
jgi:uncharacterized protein YcfJ